MKGTTEKRFVKIGVELQMNANSWQRSKQSYLYSCSLCCSRPDCLAMDCEHCPIRQAMFTNADIMKRQLTQEDYEWLEKERNLD